TGSITLPESMGSPVRTFFPTSGLPSVKVMSVNNFLVPPSPMGVFDPPDVTMPYTTSPVPVVIQATNMPPGAQLTLRIFSDNGMDQTVQATLGAQLQATVMVTFPSGVY